MTKCRITIRAQTLRWVEHALLLAGILGVGAWAASWAATAIWQDWQNWVFDSEIHHETATVAGYLAVKNEQLVGRAKTWFGLAVPRHSATHTVNRGPWSAPVRDHALIGRITIPRLRLKAIVREGTGNSTLGVAVGHIPGTAFPGEPGNVALAAHRDNLFRSLKGIHKGDLIQLETLHGLYGYQVDSIEIVTPRKVSVLHAGKYPELTLVTCYPFDYIGAAPYRFIVKARQVAADENEPSLSGYQAAQRNQSTGN